MSDGMSTAAVRQALEAAVREAKRAAGRHDDSRATRLHDALSSYADRGELPSREWIASTIRDTAVWATDDADVPLLAALGALARAAGR
jgi:hypothetical protein